MKNVVRSLDGETCFNMDELSALFTLYKVGGHVMLAVCTHLYRCAYYMRLCNGLSMNISCEVRSCLLLVKYGQLQK